MDLLAGWTEVVGKELAAGCRPLELRWSRKAVRVEDFEPAILDLAVEPAHALRLTHATDTIVARVNSWFGFAAVARVRMRQQPLVPDPGPATGPLMVSTEAPPQPAAARPELAGICDPKLRAALERMERGVRARGRARCDGAVGASGPARPAPGGDGPTRRGPTGM